MNIRPSAAHRRLSAFIGASVLALASASVWASHGSSVINLTTSNAIVAHDGAVYAQGGVGSGTGTFDPFLTLQESSHSPSTQAGTEEGYNQCNDSGCPDDSDTSPNWYDQFFGGNRTHELLASAVPTLEYDNALYREFSLDANDTGADTFMSIDQIKIFLDSQVDLTGYDKIAETFSNDTGTTVHKVFDLDAGGDQTILLSSQDLESGSGVSDVTLLVPNSAFPAECSYGSTTCDQYIYFWSAMGQYDGDNNGVDCNGKTAGLGTCDWNVTAGFEEWRVRFLPVVNVEKTADVSFDRNYTWTIEKTADPDHLSLFNGDSAPVEWNITPTRHGPDDSNFNVSGTITITNPTGAPPIPKAIPATIESVDDVLTLDSVPIDATDSVDCGVGFPYTLAAGASLECTYEVVTPDATATSTGQNVATVTIDSGIPAGDGGIQFADQVSYDGTASVDFSLATPTVTNDTATVTDPTMGVDQAAQDGVAITINDSLGCPDDEGENTNTATVTPGDGGPTDEASATVTVTCYGLTVDKTVQTSLARDYTWTITKSVSPTTIAMFNGDPEADLDWTITPTRHGPTDSGWSVTGTITITNPAPMEATGVDVTDVISHATLADVNAAVDCSADPGAQSTVDVPANDSVNCTYQATLLNGDDRTNVATATLFDIGYSNDPKDVDFSAATVSETNESATVTDPTVGVDQAAVSGTAIMVDGGATCPDDAGLHQNTATVTPNDGGPTDDASASYTVTCYGLTVSKDATTTFSRDYDWSITKSRFLITGEVDGDGDLTTLTLAAGQTYTANYSVLVQLTGHTDADHAVHGTITVSNPAPMDAEGVTVSDLVSPDIAATVDCDAVMPGSQTSVDVPAEGSAQCSYTAALSDATARTNVATATLNGIGYDSDPVDVTFDDTPDTLIDECIVVVDDNGTPDTSDDTTLGTVCLGDLNASGQTTLTTSIDIGPYASCATDQVVNTASFTTQDDANDTDESGSSSYTVNVDVPCPQGCTLTQGYWKTHNDSFKGGAPTDDAWQLLGDVDGDGVVEGEGEPFFLSGQTYFRVMWTAPKGNAYYILAHQYIAAVLNGLNDAAVPAGVQDAIDASKALFTQYTPAQIGALKGKAGNTLRSQFISLAGVLGSYNEGTYPGGPQHCDEDATSGANDAPITTASAVYVDRRMNSAI